MAILAKAATREKNGRKRNYTNKDAISKVIHYMIREEDNRICYIGGLGVCSDSEMAIEQFKGTQEVYNKCYGVRIAHEVVSFLDNEIFDQYGNNRIEEIAYYYAGVYYLQGYQVFYTIHHDTDHWHVHYAINSVSFMDGYKYNGSLKDIEFRKMYLDQVIMECTGIRAAIGVEWNSFGYFNELHESCDYIG